MRRVGRSCASFCASMAEVIPPPMMQMSDSWTVMSLLVTRGSGLEKHSPLACRPRRLWTSDVRAPSHEPRATFRFRLAERDSDRPAHLAVDQRVVTVVV